MPTNLPDPSRSALLVVDMQNGFVSPDGSCARVGLPTKRLTPTVKPCVRAIEVARRAKVPIIFTRFTYRADFADGGFLVKEKFPALAAQKALVAGTWDQALLDQLGAESSDYIVDKNRPSSFYATALETYLNGLGVRDLVVCGVTTNCCVESTVRDASQRDYRTFVLEDAVAEYDHERHLGAMKGMDALFAHLIDVERLVQAWTMTLEARSDG